MNMQQSITVRGKDRYQVADNLMAQEKSGRAASDPHALGLPALAMRSIGRRLGTKMSASRPTSSSGNPSLWRPNSRRRATGSENAACQCSR